ncbi:curli-like amyloid fiber formation chaperone CsgH [Aureimonas psammosilenae]|uniref:curli-like amyloid fiber formation chaperone CsgH n=1 Tax=Aureimonas psammosilenae TaxID=2495496 RepID=UPI001260DB99|nr:curli-like amyloid fiber formation chaperone CsgH [Aureimonas psammosilenae]
MIPISKRIVPALLTALAAGAVLAPAVSARTGDEAASCEIRASRGGGAVTLTALVHAEHRVEGSYSLRVKGRGTSIDQGGPFAARAGREAVVGTVTLGTQGASFEAKLDVTVDGETVTCRQSIRGGI